jgi:hypothetical protein
MQLDIASKHKKQSTTSVARPAANTFATVASVISIPFAPSAAQITCEVVPLPQLRARFQELDVEDPDAVQTLGRKRERSPGGGAEEVPAWMACGVILRKRKDGWVITDGFSPRGVLVDVYVNGSAELLQLSIGTVVGLRSPQCASRNLDAVRVTDATTVTVLGEAISLALCKEKVGAKQDLCGAPYNSSISSFCHAHMEKRHAKMLNARLDLSAAPASGPPQARAGLTHAYGSFSVSSGTSFSSASASSSYSVPSTNAVGVAAGPSASTAAAALLMSKRQRGEGQVPAAATTKQLQEQQKQLEEKLVGSSSSHGARHVAAVLGKAPGRTTSEIVDSKMLNEISKGPGGASSTTLHPNSWQLNSNNSNVNNGNSNNNFSNSNINNNSNANNTNTSIRVIAQQEQHHQHQQNGDELLNLEDM